MHHNWSGFLDARQRQEEKKVSVFEVYVMSLRESTTMFFVLFFTRFTKKNTC